MQNLTSLIGHPERLNKETLYELREIVARYPYFQIARLLFLQNLFLLHDPEFGEELRTSALFLPDRRVVFDMIEGSNYQQQALQSERKSPKEAAQQSPADRTATLIDNFLSTLPKEESPARRPAMKADASNDYSYFLLQLADIRPEETAEGNSPTSGETLLNNYMERPHERIALQEEIEYTPEEAEETEENDYLTGTLAKIYIKQGKYEKAIEIIRRLNAHNPKKNLYFADQIRFLQKLIINNSKKEHV